MPTGYTADILDGKVTNAQEFAAVCARAFMFTMRDASADAPLRFPVRDDAYYSERLTNAIADLARWDNSTEEEKYAEWSEYALTKEKRAEEAKEKADNNYRVLSRLLTEVKSISVPESHTGFKEFMIQQITETMRFDGAFNAEYYRVQGYTDWVDSRRADILWDLDRATKGLREAEERYRQSHEWISTLANIYDLKVSD